MVKSKSISDVRKIFEKNMTFFSDDNIKTFTEMNKKVLFMMEELEKVKPELIKIPSRIKYKYSDDLYISKKRNSNKLYPHI